MPKEYGKKNAENVSKSFKSATGVDGIKNAIDKVANTITSTSDKPINNPSGLERKKDYANKI